MSSIVRTDHDDLSVMAAPDRRRSPRAMTVYKVVKIERKGDEGLARCRNISDTGMKLDVAMPLSLNDNLTIELTPDLALPARVVWTNGDQCGVAFERSIDCSRLLTRTADEKRREGSRSPRLNSDISARISVDGELHPTTISNISQQGMLVSHKGKFRPGLHVSVMLDDGTEKSAIVQWTHDNYAGLFLIDHFSVTELGDLQSVGKPATSP